MLLLHNILFVSFLTSKQIAYFALKSAISLQVFVRIMYINDSAVIFTPREQKAGTDRMTHLSLGCIALLYPKYYPSCKYVILSAPAPLFVVSKPHGIAHKQQ